jgi:hypothetical protein
VNVLIASPGDVAIERQTIRDALDDWNAMHAEREGIVLMPLGWETHASPLMGDRAQAVINDQVGDRSDLLLGVFWTRLGSPTGEAESGTVEEIERHRASGKPVMLYFSNAPVRPDSVFEEQYRALRQFKDRCYKEGLVEVYDSVAEFREKLLRQLTHVVLDYYKRPEETHAGDDERSRTPTEPVQLELSPEAAKLLLEAVQDPTGTVLFIHTGGGLVLQTNEVELCAQGSDARSEAKWQVALESLLDQGLLVDRGQEGEVFRVTHRGYATADVLRRQ